MSAQLHALVWLRGFDWPGIAASQLNCDLTSARFRTTSAQMPIGIPTHKHGETHGSNDRTLAARAYGKFSSAFIFDAPIRIRTDTTMTTRSPTYSAQPPAALNIFDISVSSPVSTPANLRTFIPSPNTARSMLRTAVTLSQMTGALTASNAAWRPELRNGRGA